MCELTEELALVCLSIGCSKWSVDCRWKLVASIVGLFNRGMCFHEEVDLRGAFLFLLLVLTSKFNMTEWVMCVRLATEPCLKVSSDRVNLVCVSIFRTMNCVSVLRGKSASRWNCIALTLRARFVLIIGLCLKLRELNEWTLRGCLVIWTCHNVKVACVNCVSFWYGSLASRWKLICANCACVLHVGTCSKVIFDWVSTVRVTFGIF